MTSSVRGWRDDRMRAHKLIWAAYIVLVALFLRFGLTKFADAHIPGHEE
jgi:hypothetical protein